MNDWLDKVVSLPFGLRRIICDKATEYPNSGCYNTVLGMGTYLCRRCGLALFRGNSQFAAGCGWPAFDSEIGHAVKQIPDTDGLRTEIVCQRCHGHLGHVFFGEQFTKNNIRYCVNSASLDFVNSSDVMDSEEAIVAGGCFWGVEHFMRQSPGVLRVESGYIGGDVPEPTYEQICQGNTGHYEAVRVVFDSGKTDYQAIIKRFFEIHDPTQYSGQGPDLGPQYQSAIFYYNEEQKSIAQTLINILQQRGFDVATRLLEARLFWPAEEYHQNYYKKHHKIPYCHQPEARFD